MASPLLLSTYPANGDVGIPIGEQIEIVFDRGIDLDSAKKNVVLYGPDFDHSSGPDQAKWVDEKGNNPLFLRSPNFKGLVETNYELVYLDSLGVVLDPQPTIVDEADEVARSFQTKLIITPLRPLAPNATYKLHVVGNTDGAGRGLGSRTVFDLIPGVNAGTGSPKIYGSYTGASPETINIEVLTAGSTGVAEYQWYYTTLGVGAAETKETSRRFRRLTDGTQVRFDSGSFEVGDNWTLKVEPREFLASSYTVQFSTNDGTYSVAPDSPSTPASSEPSAQAAIGESTSELFEVISWDPPDGSTNLPFQLCSHITITFSHPINPATVTDETVTVLVYPISGVYSDTYEPIEFSKLLCVEDNTITITF